MEEGVINSKYQLYRSILDAISIKLTVKGKDLPFNAFYGGKLEIELDGDKNRKQKKSKKHMLMSVIINSAECETTITKIVNKDWDASALVFSLSTTDNEWVTEISKINSQFSTFIGIQELTFGNTSMKMAENSSTLKSQEKQDNDITFSITIEQMPLDVQCPRTDSLCQRESNFVEERTQTVKKHMNGLFELHSESYVPKIAIIGSGGGMRAVIGMSGALAGLDDINVLDCAMYTAGLSGSAWYLLALYASRAKFKQLTQLNNEIRRKLNEFHGSHSKMALEILTHYFKRIGSDTMANAFGLLIGNLLLQKVPQWSFVLFDSNGKTAKVRSTQLSPASRKSVTFYLANDTKYKVEVLCVADEEKELERFANLWVKTPRAVAIEKEITKRRIVPQQEHGYLNVWPRKKRVWSRVLFDTDGKIAKFKLSPPPMPAVLKDNSRKLNVLRVPVTGMLGTNRIAAPMNGRLSMDQVMQIFAYRERLKRVKQHKEVPKMSLVLFDINGNTGIVESKHLSRHSEGRDEIAWKNMKVEVLHAADSRPALTNFKETWTKSHQASAIRNEKVKRKEKDIHENGFLHILSEENGISDEHKNEYYWSELADTIDKGTVPLPLIAALHVRDEKTNNEHHEWTEFSPYEVFMPRYGAAIDMKNFGNQFQAGYVTDVYEEKPIHFLLGMCGSAYAIFRNFRPLGYDRYMGWRDISLCICLVLNKFDRVCVGSVPNFLRGITGIEKIDEVQATTKTDQGIKKSISAVVGRAWIKSSSMVMTLIRGVGKGIRQLGVWCTCKSMVKTLFRGVDEVKRLSEDVCSTLLSKCGYLICTMIIEVVGTVITILLFFLVNDQHVGYQEGDDNDIKTDKMMFVDAGLAFNSPYPAVLRPAREIDIILSFDFSDRGRDDNWPFKQLEKAKIWANERQIPFPDIKEKLKEIKNEVVENDYEELYVFKGVDKQPTIIHFVMINKYNEDLQIHHDYSTLRFSYSEEEFNKFHLMFKDHVLKNKHKIIRCIKDKIDCKDEIRKIALTKKENQDGI